MLEFPYGIADFETIRTDGMVYVDRTPYLPIVENMGRILVFLRPRRFGKSLWLQTLRHYYDLAQRAHFEALFGDLYIGKNPTKRRNQYFILHWNFSRVDPSGGVDAIKESLREHVQIEAEAFLTPRPGA